MIDVRRVANKRMMKEFIMLPWAARLYENDPAWVPPIIGEVKTLLDRNKGYFFEIAAMTFRYSSSISREITRWSEPCRHARRIRYGGPLK